MNVVPFTQEEIDRFNNHQAEHNKHHPYTCGSPTEIPECFRKNNIGETIEEREGMLKATTEGLVCPCGKYVQNWFH